MARLRTILTLACVTALPVALPLALGGCVGALVVGGLGAAAGGGYAAGQERGVTGSVDDFSVKTDIEKGLMKAELQLQGAITTNVYDGRVLLTGHVPSQDIKIAAEQVAGKTHDVRAVYNEIEVAPTTGVFNGANDAWISAQLRSQLVLDSDVRSVNYTIDTTNGSVYLIGSARSQAELDRATQIARYVPGVRRVVSYVEIRGGSPVAAMPAPSPTASPGPGRPSTSPNAPIEVQKL
jgi:osmotically-inducible protein OsmY